MAILAESKAQTHKDTSLSIDINLSISTRGSLRTVSLTKKQVKEVLDDRLKINVRVNKGEYKNVLIEELNVDIPDFTNKLNTKIKEKIKQNSPLELIVKASKKEEELVQIGVLKIYSKEEKEGKDFPIRQENINLNLNSNDCCPKHPIEVIKLNIDMCMPDCKEAFITGPKNDCKSTTGGKLIVRQNQFTAIKLINFNPFRYSIDIKGVEESLFQDDASTFSLLPQNKTTQDTETTKSETKAEILKPEKTVDEKIEELKDSLESIESLWKELKNLKAGLSKLQCIAQDSIKMYFRYYNLKYDKNDLASDNIKKKLEALKKEAKEKNESNLKDLRTNIETEENKKPKNENSVKVAKDELEKTEEKIKEQDEQIDKLNDKILEDTKTQLEVIEQILRELNMAQTTVYSMPYQVKAKNIDMIRFDLEKKDLLTNSTSTYSYNVFVRGGVKIDFSTGIMLSALSKNEYKYLDVGTKKQIVRKNNNNYSFLSGTLMNTSFRINETFHVGITNGLGFSTEGQFQLLNGIFFGLGKFQRILFHGGFALGWVERLQQPYYENGTFDNLDADVTIQTLMSSWFIGITYNLTKPKTETPSQQAND